MNYEEYENNIKDLEEINRKIEEKKYISLSKRYVDSEILHNERFRQVEQESEKLKEESNKIKAKLSWQQRIKQIFKEHGFTIFSITASVGTIISSIVIYLTSGVSAISKTVGNGFKSLAKQIAKILPGMIGAITSFIFKAAGEVFGLLAKNSWLLILFIVTLAVDLYTKK